MALAALTAAAVVVVVQRSGDKTPALFTAGHFPSCRDAGIVPGSSKQGTCTTSHALVTVVDQGGLLAVPGLRARATKTTVTPAATPSGKARRRMRVTVALSLTNTGTRPLFSDTRDPSLRLTIGRDQVAPDGAAQSRAGAFRTTALAPGATRRGVLSFELGGAITDAFRREHGSLGLTVEAPRGRPARLAVIRVRD